MNEQFVYNPEECTEVISLDLTDEEFILIAKAAHQRDITINHFINLAIHEAIQHTMKEVAEEEGR